jgi:mono/diheme cytochrome c family protein
MKKIVIATLLIAFAVALLFFVLQPGKVVSKFAPAVAPFVPVTVESQGVAQPAAPAVSDMSLPMPLGLKGDPAKGGDFFMKNCFTCHGVHGDGNGPRAYFITPPPRNFLLETSRQRLNRPALFEAIANGRLGTNMPAWSKVLSNQEIADVAEFVFQNFISALPIETTDGQKRNQGKPE